MKKATYYVAVFLMFIATVGSLWVLSFRADLTYGPSALSIGTAYRITLIMIATLILSFAGLIYVVYHESHRP